MRLGLIVCFGTMLFASTGVLVADEANPDKDAVEFFEKKIRPLLASRCYECHASDKAEENGHLVLDGRTGLLAGGTRGPRLIMATPLKKRPKRSTGTKRENSGHSGHLRFTTPL